MMYAFATPYALLLLPLALVPLVYHGQRTIGYSSVSILPVDRLSDVTDGVLRVLAAVCVLALVIGIAGIYRTEQTVERIGQGAQTVILLDSSGSMDTAFVTGNEHSSRAAVWGTYTSKGQIARRLLAQFAAQRKQDMFALYVFSGNPIPILALTEKQPVVQAAIAAGAIEHGLASTNLATGLVHSLEYFDGKAFTGSRVVMLVSDGAATLTVPQQDSIKLLLKKHRVTLYWIYLRARNSPGLLTNLELETARQIAPEQLVHKFFSEMGLPYRAFSADNPAALQDAITAIDKLQNLPIRYHDVVPRRDLSQRCFVLALVLVLALATAKFGELQRWH